jgi:dUTP pyrophosphatase
MNINDLSKLENIGEYASKLEKLIEENEKGGDIDYDMIYEEFGLDLKQLEEDMLNYSPKLDLGFVKLNSDAVDPFYNYDGDSGFDLYSTEEVTLPPFGRALVSTGLAFEIKDGYEIQVRSKSGLALKQGLMVLNSPGTVDNSYIGEVKVILFNVNNHEFVVNKGMKIAQAVLTSVVNGKWVNLVNKKEINKTDRADKGFGSTGI